LSRYVLLNLGDGDVDAAARLAQEGKASIIDRTGDRALLVEASSDWAEQAGRLLPGWRVVEEGKVSRPRPPFPRPGWKLPGSDGGD